LGIIQAFYDIYLNLHTPHKFATIQMYFEFMIVILNLKFCLFRYYFSHVNACFI